MLFLAACAAANGFCGLLRPELHFLAACAAANQLMCHTIDSTPFLAACAAANVYAQAHRLL